MLGGNMDNLVGGSRKKRLGDLLVDAGVITQDQLMRALQIQKTEKKGALCQVLGCDSLNHAPLLDLELFLYLIYFTMILGMANKPSSAHLKIN